MINMHLFTIYATQRRAFSQCSSSRARPKVGAPTTTKTFHSPSKLFSRPPPPSSPSPSLHWRSLLWSQSSSSSSPCSSPVIGLRLAANAAPRNTLLSSRFHVRLMKSLDTFFLWFGSWSYCCDLGEILTDFFCCFCFFDWILAGRVFCKKGCGTDAETWEECKCCFGFVVFCCFNRWISLFLGCCFVEMQSLYIFHQMMLLLM